MAKRHGTTYLRESWGPDCLSYREATVVEFPSSEDPAKPARLHVHPLCAEAFRQLAAIMAKHNYPVRRGDTGGLVCRAITGSSTKKSLHSFGIAGDINWQTNPYGKRLVTDMPSAMVEEIKTKVVLNDGTPVFRWGGDYRTNKDAMHFEVVVSRQDMQTIGMRGGNAAPMDDEDEPVTPDEIKRYQARLEILSEAMGKPAYNPGTPDGQLGPATRRALVAFNRDRGRTGEVDEFDRLCRNDIDTAMQMHHWIPRAMRQHEARKH